MQGFLSIRRYASLFGNVNKSADLTRLTFDPAKHYRAVQQQQGRVQLDSDWNEQMDITAHRIETETLDVIGPAGAPLHADGFRLVSTAASLTPDETEGE